MEDAESAGAWLPARRTMQFADGETSYLEWAGEEGAPLLAFLHANGFNAETYRAILSPLAGRFRIVAPDHRGHGQTTRALPVSGPRWERVRDDAIEFIEALGERPAVLAGHSMGATASLMAAGKMRDIAGSLVLAEPVLQSSAAAFYALAARRLGREDKMLPLVGPARRRRALFASREMAIKAYRGRGAFRGWEDEMLADYVRSGLIENGDGQFRLACPPHWESAAYARFPFGMAKLGKRVDLPVTILMGARGSSTDRRVVRKFAKYHGHTQIAHIPGTTHFLPMEAPEALREAIITSSRA